MTYGWGPNELAMMSDLEKGHGIKKSVLSNELEIQPDHLVYCSNRKLALIER